MNLFKSYIFTWWQVGVFKVALLAIGIALGAYWSAFFLPYMTAIIVIAVATSLYSAYVALQQQ